MKALKIVAGLLYTASLNAQPNSEYNYFKTLSPNDEVICTNYDVQIDIINSKGKLLINYQVSEELFYLNDNIDAFSEREISSSDLISLKSYEAFTLVPGEKKYERVNVEKYSKSSLPDDHVFHDDRQSLKFTLLQLKKGAKSVINSKYEIKEPRMLPTFLISPYINHYNANFTVNISEGIELGIDTFNLGKVKLKQSYSQNGKTRTYEWNIVNTDKLRYEKTGPEINYLAPQIIVRIKSYLNDGVKVSVLDNLNDLHLWYSGFISEVDEGIDFFKPISDSIVQGSTSDKEKAIKIYNWVQKNIRYIAFEAAYAGVMPEKASQVYVSRFGDCKGMSNLLQKLLESQNLKAYLCWIGTRDLPFKYSEIPSMVVDNHMIVALKLNEDLLFLDPTHSNLPLELPSPFIQGKEALLNLETGKKYEICEVPVIEPSINMLKDSCSVKMQGSDVLGEGLATLTGYIRMDFMDNINGMEYKKFFNYCRSMLIKGNNNFVLDTVWLENYENKNAPLFINYKFKIPNYTVIVENEYYINLNFDKVDIHSPISPLRNVPVNYRFSFTEANIVSLKLNDNQKVISIPNDDKFDTGNFSFYNNYKTKNEYLLRYSGYCHKPLIIYPDQFEAFSKIQKMIQNSNQFQVIIK